MTSLHVICGLALLPIQNPGYAYALNHVQYALNIKPCAICIPDTGCCILVLLAHLHERLLTTLQRCKATKYTLHCFQSKISLVWKYGTEDFWYGMVMEWKKIASMEYGKIVFHSIPCDALVGTIKSLL